MFSKEDYLLGNYVYKVSLERFANINPNEKIPVYTRHKIKEIKENGDLVIIIGISKKQIDATITKKQIENSSREEGFFVPEFYYKAVRQSKFQEKKPLNEVQEISKVLKSTGNLELDALIRGIRYSSSEAQYLNFKWHIYSHSKGRTRIIPQKS